jgi:hypothetical protein
MANPAIATPTTSPTTAPAPLGLEGLGGAGLSAPIQHVVAGGEQTTINGGGVGVVVAGSVAFFCATANGSTGGRKGNEDSVAVALSGEVLQIVVADGMGGHGLGDLASGAVVRSLTADFLEAVPFDQAVASLPGAVMAARDNKVAEILGRH